MLPLRTQAMNGSIIETCEKGSSLGGDDLPPLACPPHNQVDSGGRTMNENTPKQLTLFDAQFQNIRRMMHDGTLYFSAVDVMAQFSDLESKPAVLWRRTKQRLEQDGFQLYQNLIQLKLKAKDGKHYATDCADGLTILRIVQSIPSEKAEPVREWLAALGYREIDEAAHPEKAVLRRRIELQRLEQAGYGDHPEVKRLTARNQGIEVLKSLKKTIAKVCDNPNYGRLMNAEYQDLFGETTSTLKMLLEVENIRDGLQTPQLSALMFAEHSLQMIIDNRHIMSNDDIRQAIAAVFIPIGISLREICAYAGVHPVTNQVLLEAQS
jgi:DNA-damage-inducible protein D